MRRLLAAEPRTPPLSTPTPGGQRPGHAGPADPAPRIHPPDPRTGAAAATRAAAIDLGTAYELHPKVALRPEPFGALAYHYGNRRLSFVRSTELVGLLQTLGDHDTLGDALRASTPDARWPALTHALSQLLASETIRAR